MFERYFPPFFVSSALSFKKVSRESICGGWGKRKTKKNDEEERNLPDFLSVFRSRAHQTKCGALQVAAARKHSLSLELTWKAQAV